MAVTPTATIAVWPRFKSARRLLGLDLRVLELAQILVVAQRLVRLVGEVLDRLVIEQRVHRALVGVRVRLHRRAIEARPPLRHCEAEARVRGERRERDAGEAPVVGPDQDRSDQQHLQHGRDDRVEGPVEQIRDGLAAALHVARDAARPAREMEAQRERVEVAEHEQRHFARGARQHAGEHHLAELGEDRETDARSAVGEQQRDGQDQQARLHVEPVDDLLQRHRNQQVHELGAHDQAHRQHDAPEVGPQVGHERRDHGEIAPRRDGARALELLPHELGHQGARGEPRARNRPSALV